MSHILAAEQIRALLGGGEHGFPPREDGTAEPRPVTLGDWYQEDWIVTQGLRGGETVAVDGAIKLRPGAAVKVAEAGPATGPAEKVGPAENVGPAEKVDSDDAPVATVKP